MKLSELRKWASAHDGGRQVAAIDIKEMRELVADIDAELLRCCARGRAEGGQCVETKAPADSELGVELFKIRDRLNSLEETSEDWKEWRDGAPIGELNNRVAELEIALARIGKAMRGT